MIRCKKVSPSLCTWSRSFLEMSRQFFLCSGMNILVTQWQLTLENLSTSQIIWWAVSVDTSSCRAISSTVILLSARIKSFTLVVFKVFYLWRSSMSGIIFDTCTPFFKFLDPFIHISLVQTAIPILGRHSSKHFTWFYTFCSKKSDHSSLFFMCCVLQGRSHRKNWLRLIWMM